MNNILDYFPLTQPRQKQIKACEYIQHKVEEGYKNIVIAAPTGIGKSAIGVCAGFWIASHIPPLGVEPGAYYLVTQKLLQDQITNDIYRYRDACQSCASIKTAAEYECPEYGNCCAGIQLATAAGKLNERSADFKDKFTPEAWAKKTHVCYCLAEHSCTYKVAKARWLSSRLSITNYPYFFTARKYTHDIKPRQMLLADECHSLEDQLIRFVDGAVSLAQVKKWTNWTELPKFDQLSQYVSWLEQVYIPKLDLVLKGLQDLETLADDVNHKVSKELAELDNYVCKLRRAVTQLKLNQDNWVFWREDSKDGQDAQYIARPVFGAPFVAEFIESAAPIRLYMSAYPGVPDVFCRNLGLNRDEVAWANLNSDFPVANRRVHYWPIGSMGKSSKLNSLPAMLRTIVKIASKQLERGLIHAQSYELGGQISDALTASGMGDRIIFPKTADDREVAMEKHSETAGAILISPSMKEGFDFAGDKARWQILPKVPYGFLADKQVAKKLELDPEWYQAKAVIDIIQSCGRICRSKDDHGVTYVLDSDFKRLWEKNEHMFPNWFKEAVIFHDKK